VVSFCKKRLKPLNIVVYAHLLSYPLPEPRNGIYKRDTMLIRVDERGITTRCHPNGGGKGILYTAPEYLRLLASKS